MATLQAGIIAAATTPKNAGGTERRGGEDGRLDGRDDGWGAEGGADGYRGQAEGERDAGGRSVSTCASASSAFSVITRGAGGKSDGTVEGIRGGPGMVGMRGGGGNVFIGPHQKRASPPVNGRRSPAFSRAGSLWPCWQSGVQSRWRPWPRTTRFGASWR